MKNYLIYLLICCFIICSVSCFEGDLNGTYKATFWGRNVGMSLKFKGSTAYFSYGPSEQKLSYEVNGSEIRLGPDNQGQILVGKISDNKEKITIDMSDLTGRAFNMKLKFIKN